jgi:hypothetical protein
MCTAKESRRLRPRSTHALNSNQLFLESGTRSGTLSERFKFTPPSTFVLSQLSVRGAQIHKVIGIDCPLPLSSPTFTPNAWGVRMYVTFLINRSIYFSSGSLLDAYFDVSLGFPLLGPLTIAVPPWHSLYLLVLCQDKGVDKKRQMCLFIILCNLTISCTLVNEAVSMRGRRRGPLS